MPSTQIAKENELLRQTRGGKGGVIGGGAMGHGQRRPELLRRDIRTRSSCRRTVCVASIPQPHGGSTALRLADGAKSWFVPPVAGGATPGCSPAQSAAVTARSPEGCSPARWTATCALTPLKTAKSCGTSTPSANSPPRNGAAAKGGASGDGPGPVIVNGMVLVNSGYTRFGGAPGNVLLAFKPQ